MRLIDSAGFSTAREITSFRQAVMIMGLKKLFRWAALLLTASKYGDAQRRRSAIPLSSRGRLMELLALEFMSEEEAEQAFVVGIFSLLDAMLRRSLAGCAATDQRARSRCAKPCSRMRAFLVSSCV